MAHSGSFLREHFQCSICLELFTLPVTLPCGHNFCSHCISQAWDVSSRYQCPLCKEDFNRRPDLRVNTMLSETSSTLRQTETCISRMRKNDGEEEGAAGDVTCDVCLEDKRKAVKSCLVCVASYCGVHLEPHTRIPGLKRHELMEPVPHLESRMCKKHERLLEMFCRSDQSFLCQQCAMTDHKKHNFTSLGKEFEERRIALDQDRDELNQRIQGRQKKIKDLELKLNLIQDKGSKESASGVQVFTSFIQMAQILLSQLLENIETRKNSAEEEVRVQIGVVREELSELEKTKVELEELSQTEDQLHFLQSFKSLELEESKVSNQIKVQESFEGMVKSAVARLQEEISSELKKLTHNELGSIQKFAVDVSLDPDTAHAALILSDDNKHVHCGDIKQIVPYSPSRFTESPCVLGSQHFESGKFYYEVEVKNKTKWYLGVAKESVKRKGQVAANPAMGLWALWFKNGHEYRALDEPAVPLVLERKLERVGVFVDYDEGIVAFYDTDTASKVYEFTRCTFTEKLRPFFGPCSSDGGRNTAPLVITQVRGK